MKKISSYVLAPVIAAVFFGGIIVSMALNLWITESTKTAVKYSSGEFAGLANPGDIRGSYSLSDIEKNFGIPVAVTARAFGAESWPDPAAFKAKDLEALYEGAPEGVEIGTDSVRLFVATYLGRPYAPEETTRLPRAALTELAAKLSPADLKAMEKYAFEGEAQSADGMAATALTGEPASAEATAPTVTAPTTAEDHGATAAEDRAIKGKTTFNDLLSWGVSRSTINGIMGMDIGPASVTVRDFCLERGLEFSEYRAALQAVVPAR